MNKNLVLSAYENFNLPGNRNFLGIILILKKETRMARIPGIFNAGKRDVGIEENVVIIQIKRR